MNIKQKVELVLEEFSSTRDTDQKLVPMVWWKFHKDKMQQLDGKWYIQLADIFELEKPESISRVRRKIQNEEKRFLACKEVQEQRKRYEEDLRHLRGLPVPAKLAFSTI